MKKLCLAIIFCILILWLTVPACRGAEPPSEDTVSLVARLVMAEAGDQTYLAQISLASVIRNRVQNSAYPDTVYGVVFQRGVFASVEDGRFLAVSVNGDDPVWQQCLMAARLAFWGLDPTDGACEWQGKDGAAMPKGDR